MTEPSRKKAFITSAVALICMAAVVSTLKPRSSDGGAATARFGPLVAGDGGASRSRAAHARRASGPAPTPVVRNSLTAARASARTFVRAFLRYQAGDKSSGRLLARSGSPQVHRYLVTSPTRSVGQAPHAELRSVQLYATAHPAEAKASALLRYARRQSLFEFLLRRGRSRWRVTELYP
jgi:hypothetical protein